MAAGLAVHCVLTGWSRHWDSSALIDGGQNMLVSGVSAVDKLSYVWVCAGDFSAIASIGQDGKMSQPAAIGRFGLGFNSV